MTTIVNTPPGSNDSGGGMGLVFGIFALVVVIYIFFMYGLPAIQRIQIGSPQITIPAKIDVTVEQPKQE